MSVVSNESIPTSAYYASSLDTDVATIEMNEDGEFFVKPIGAGSTKIVITLQDQVAECQVDVATTYFDPKFAYALSLSRDLPLSDDGDINIADSEVMAKIDAITDVNVSVWGLTSVMGVEYFANLKSFKCYSNNLSSLDLTNCTNLTDLDCRENYLTSLDLTGCTALTDVNCGSNCLTSLDLTGCTALTDFSCDSNYLTSLDLTRCSALQNLYCNDNSLTSLDVSSNSNLSYLHCGDQTTGDITLTLTQSQYDGVWSSCSSNDANSNVNTTILP